MRKKRRDRSKHCAHLTNDEFVRREGRVITKRRQNGLIDIRCYNRICHSRKTYIADLGNNVFSDRNLIPERMVTLARGRLKFPSPPAILRKTARRHVDYRNLDYRNAIIDSVAPIFPSI